MVKKAEKKVEISEAVEVNVLNKRKTIALDTGKDRQVIKE